MTNRNKAVLSVLAVFLLGALSGGTLVYLLVLPDSVTPVAETRSGKGRGSRTKEAVERLSKELNLDARQKAQVDQIFQDARRESHQAFKVIGAGIQRRMKEVLTPEQFAKFEKDMRERWRSGDRGGRPPSRDGPPPPRDDAPQQ